MNNILEQVEEERRRSERRAAEYQEIVAMFISATDHDSQAIERFTFWVIVAGVLGFLAWLTWKVLTI